MGFNSAFKGLNNPPPPPPWGEKKKRFGKAIGGEG